MDDYQKSFVAKEKAEALQAYVDKIAELRKLAEAENADKGDEPKGDEPDESDDTV